MQARSSYLYIHIGLSLRMLRNYEGTSPKHAKLEIARLKRNLGYANFAVTLAALDRSVDHGRLLATIEGTPDDGQLEVDDVTDLREKMEGLETVVFAEAMTKELYTLPERRYDVRHLLEAPEKLLTSGSFDALSPLAQIDFRSACRCLVFGEATAAAFHLLRATEQTLKDYYHLHRKTKRLEKPMWGPMLEQLRKKKRNKPSDTLLESLNLVRGSYRNPTQHPEATYTIDSAQDLFGLCADVLGKMTKELAGRLPVGSKALPP